MGRYDLEVAASAALGLVSRSRASLTLRPRAASLLPLDLLPSYRGKYSCTLVLEQGSRTRVLVLVRNYSLVRVQVPYTIGNARGPQAVGVIPASSI
jgi:hypothetical protein